MATPITYPYSQLQTMDNQALQAIWDAINAPRCCERHFPSDQEAPLDEDWATAVLATVEQRGLRVEFQHKPFECPTCHEPLRAESAEVGPDMFAVCDNCRTRRRYGDHLDCSFGPLEPIPTA